MLDIIFKKIDKDIDLTREDLKFLLSMEDDAQLDQLYHKAYEVKTRNVGKLVYLRGIIEFSNICVKDCLYCGIRKSNTKAQRFMIPEEDVITMAMWAYENDYGSIVLQSGERSDREFVDMVERIIHEIKRRSNSKLGITICLGEQSEETYQRWFDAGAHRYLLRIESSNPDLYRNLHPEDHDFEQRLNCIKVLQKIGYQTGTGVLIGVPGQTIDHLVNDLMLYKELDIDMIGMGPYLVHHETPLAEKAVDFNEERQLKQGLKMIACARLLLKDVNIASTTALQALHPQGRELGVMAGGNVIMPNITDVEYRKGYQLYENKPCTDENASQCRFCLQHRVESIGEKIGYGQWGDSIHYAKRIKQA
jgi:biotin synthase